MGKFKEFRRGYQPWEHEGGGGSMMGSGVGGGDLHSSALDHDFVSTLGGPSAGPADPWEGLADWLDATGWGTAHMEKQAAACGVWLKGEGAKSVLEVGSALGLTTKRLVRDGLKVTAVDPSPALVAHTKANAKGAKVLECDLAELPSGPFDAVVSLRNALSRLAVEGQAEQLLGAARKALKPRGLLSVAFFNREGLDEGALNKVYPSEAFDYKGKRTLLYDQWQAHPDGGDRFVWAPLVMVGDYAIDWIRRAVPYRFFRLDEVRAALKAAGFEPLAAVDAADGASAASKACRRIEVRARAK